MTVLAGALAVQPASAQGFTVEPMVMQANPLPRQSISLPLKIFNTAIDGPRTILLRLVDLSEQETGSWSLIEPDTGKIPPGQASSLSWTSLSAASANIGPQQPTSIVVTFRPPANAAGTYFAGIVAETPVPANPTGVVVRTRFLIPLIIEIRGRTVQEHIGLQDVALDFQQATARSGPTTTADMSIANTGRTFSRVKGQITVERQNGTMWRPRVSGAYRALLRCTRGPRDPPRSHVPGDEISNRDAIP